MLKKYLQLIFIVLPIILLLVVSSYFAYDTWMKYQSNSTLKAQMQNAKLLQSLEHSALNEIVCVATMSEHKELIKKICNSSRKTTNMLMQEILQQKDDTSLYTLEKSIFNIRQNIENNGNVAVEKLVNGNLNKEMNGFIQRYTEDLKGTSHSMEKKELIRHFSDISKISYATESEKALVSYYLALKKPIPSKNLIYWDKTVTASQIPEDSFYQNNSISENINDIWKEKNFQTVLRGIEEIRLDIMSHSETGKYKLNVAAWVGLLNQKQKVLYSVENMLSNEILRGVSDEIEKNTFTLVTALLGILLSLIGLTVFIISWRNTGAKKKLLDNLLNKVSQLSSESDSLKIQDNVSGYQMAYDYIGTYYETLSEREATLEMENKMNTAFLSNLAYEIQTPMNGISGYTKLLKETELNIEQNEFVSIIENSYENLDNILNKLSDDTVLANQKLEVENITFDIVKKIEFAVETFSMKADKKDILVGLYIDPTLPRNVKGDSTKLSQIVTNLIDNAVELSSAYDTIDVILEKIHSDDEQVNVKFSVKDHGIGYNEDELASLKKEFNNVDLLDDFSGTNMKNLTISNKIIRRMGGKLNVVSKKGEGTEFYFILSFEKDTKEDESSIYPTFEEVKVGLALPRKDIHRQVDVNLKRYVKYLGAQISIYDYETLFEKETTVELPDILFIYHNYARLEGELESFAKLPCKVALITSGTLRSRINTDKYQFSSIMYTPVTLSKIVKIFKKSKLNQTLLIEDLSEGKKYNFENIHALIAEDNDISQKIITNILRKVGMKVTIAKDGKKAFELRCEQDFDILFMDIEMPIMDGLETTSKILYYEGINQLNHIPIIALATDIDKNNKKKFLELGMDDYLAKPINVEDIYQCIQKYCIDIPRELAKTEEDELIAKVLSGDFLKE